jgi:hypothetical protein
MPSDVEQAEHVLNNLQQKREVLVARGHSLGEERGKISFAAHAGGDAKARKQLDELNRELALHDAELRSLDCAIAEAAARVKTAQAAEARAADGQRAEELSKHVDELSQIPAYIEKHLTAALKGLIAFERGVAELHQLGVAFPTDIQLRLGMVAVLGTWLQQLPKLWWNEIAAGLRFRAPNERKSALSYWAQIEPSLRNIIAQAVDAPVSKAPAMQRPDARDRQERAAAMGEFLGSGGA